MTQLVDPTDIERIVGAKRHAVQHLARAVSEEQVVYILHSQRCLDSGIDLTCCTYSVVLDRGIELDDWRDSEDKAVVVVIGPTGRLTPGPDVTGES